MVDDYDMVATNNPLLPLLEYLPAGPRHRLHVIVARRSGGASGRCSIRCSGRSRICRSTRC